MDIDAMQRQLRDLLKFRDDVHALTGGSERFAKQVAVAKENLAFDKAIADREAAGAPVDVPAPETGAGGE